MANLDLTYKSPKNDAHRPQIRDRRWDRSRAKSLPEATIYWQDQCESTYCFGAHMHEIRKYFLFTENQKQMSESVLSHPCMAAGVQGVA